jgi:ATP-dependent exoDNAse (exonuclease V) beta subunit
MLTIYSASAGTGKTHTLTGEYLSLLFRGKERHRHILAVTFTNKATAEMKDRIVRELFCLADNRKSDYVELLSEGGRIGETDLRRRAKELLTVILHDYAAFNICTIDRFFQQTIRAFTREIGLRGNYQIEMNETLLMEEAVESMLADLAKSENAALMDWLLRFTQDKIEEGGSWDIRRDIMKLGGQLFKESYKARSNKIQKDLQQKQSLSDYQKTLTQIVRSAQQTAKELGRQGLALIRQHGLQPSDFIRGASSPFFFFEKLSSGKMDPPPATFCRLVDQVEGYLAKKASSEMREAAERIYTNGMNELIRNVVAFFDRLTDYYTAAEIARNFYAMGILADLSGHIARWREDNNKMLIADTTELLNKVIDGAEIPFIYEKTGTHIEHYLIDEFQDTSAMQWANFRPLLKDSLDSGRSNLLVGDVKQSIYRFRNSDWTLLDRTVKEEFSSQTQEKNLDTNWRSRRRIVEFNNRLFKAIPTILQQSYNEEIAQSSSLAADPEEHNESRITSAYRHVEQRLAPPFADKGGHVYVQFLVDNGDQNWKEQSLAQLPHQVEQLQEKGYELRDIAILTRTGAEGQIAAETLLEYKETHPDSPYKYDIISEDSLTVHASLSVRWIIEMLRYLNRFDANQTEETARNAYRAQLACAILQRKKTPGSAALNHLIRPFPPKIIDELRRLANRSLYELAEGVFRLFETHFPENELVFIQAFLDLVAEFSRNETADTERFLTWWDDVGNGKKIATPDSQNAIRIMTIHKSKGLGFKALIIPFADWKIDQKDSILWCRPTRAPFDKMSLVPVRYGKALRNTIFAPDYFKEKLHAYMDSLNTLYVACTRAKEELILFAPRPKTATTISIAGLLWDGLSVDREDSFDTETGIYEQGASWRPPDIDPSHSETQELPMKRFRSVTPDKRIQLRLQRKGGFVNNEKWKYGILMHEILSVVEKQADLQPAIAAKYRAGELRREEAETLTEKLTTLIREEPAKKWFSGAFHVMNEVEILFASGQSCRPDRVMIDPTNSHVTLVDYKFGEQRETFHHRQMEQYIALVREMGYPDVEGFLWYITLNEVQYFH